jgi:hypothetical protein
VGAHPVAFPFPSAFTTFIAFADLAAFLYPEWIDCRTLRQTDWAQIHLVFAYRLHAAVTAFAFAARSRLRQQHKAYE